MRNACRFPKFGDPASPFPKELPNLQPEYGPKWEPEKVTAEDKALAALDDKSVPVCRLLYWACRAEEAGAYKDKEDSDGQWIWNRYKYSYGNQSHYF